MARRWCDRDGHTPLRRRRRPVVLICRRYAPRPAPTRRNRRVAAIADAAAAVVGRSTVVPRLSDRNYSHETRQKKYHIHPRHGRYGLTPKMSTRFFRFSDRRAPPRPLPPSPTSKFDRRATLPYTHLRTVVFPNHRPTGQYRRHPPRQVVEPACRAPRSGRDDRPTVHISQTVGRVPSIGRGWRVRHRTAPLLTLSLFSLLLSP